MSTYLVDELKEGEQVDFKHIEFNVKIQAPFGVKKIGMLVGGTGITPMIQALHAILGDGSSETQVSMLYGSRVEYDILGRSMLDSWSSKHKDRLQVVHVLSHEPEGSGWEGPRGHIDRELISKYMPSPDDKDSMIFICGPPPMYAALCGPREDKELGGLLKEMGYEKSQVYKF
jgi:cytochrome-b5 reductase